MCRMFFEVTATGEPIRKRRYVFSETFAAIAMSEYSIASGDKSYAEKSLKMYYNIQRLISTPGLLPSKYCENVHMQGHSLTMILINTASRIREAINAPELTEQIDKSVMKLRKDFMHPEFNALLETVGPNGEFIDTINGRLINPGHCIETAWFILEEAKLRNWDKELLDTALTILDWSWANLTDAQKGSGETGASKVKALPIQPGDVKWKDVNGDGVIDNYDLVKVGNTTPHWLGGFTSTLS